MENLLQKIDFLMQRDGIKSKLQLSKAANIPYSTLTSLYNKDFKKAKLPTIEAICRVFGVTLDYLCRDEITDPNYGLSPLSSSDLSEDETQLVEDYRLMNDEGKEKVCDYVADLKDNPKYKKCSESRMDKEA